MYFYIYYQILTRADAVIVPGKASLKYWKSYGLKNIFIVHYYWLDSNMLKCREIPSQLLKLRNNYDIVVMYLGRLIEKRGLDVLMKAFSTIVKKHNLNIVLIVAGTGPLLDRLKALASDLGIWERTVFLGPVSESIKECLYRITDIFVYVPIITQLPEEWPIPPLEAMRLGVPTIISSATGSALDLLPGVIVVKWGSVEELEKALERIILNRNLRNSISKRAIEIANKIDEDIVVVELVNTIKEIARNKRKSL
jgi:glycosyltransferase involved in cell wall biosynthesis